MLVHRRRLPHIDVIGVPQFITFRLKNSLPVSRPFLPGQLSSGKVFRAMDRLLDEARSGPTFLRIPQIADMVCASLFFGAEVGHYDLHAWVIMQNHVHLLLTPLVSTSTLLGSLKRTTSRRANLLLYRTGQAFWQEESYDHLVRSDEGFRRIQRYIENNPVNANLVGKPEEYLWSSAGRPARPGPEGTPDAVAMPLI